MMGRSGERESGISVLAARHDDDDDVYINICSAFNKFPDSFVQASKIVLALKISVCYSYDILWDDWPIFLISDSNEQLHQQLKYTLLRAWLSQLVNFKTQSGRWGHWEQRYATKFCLHLEKIDATETYGMLQTAFRPSLHGSSISFEWHKRFKEG